MKINSFDLKPGTLLNGRYQVVEQLGAGWEGEVYLVKERETGIERAAKLFFPQRNPHGRTSRYYAKKLHKLRNCDILIHYSTQDTIYIDGEPISYLVSEFIDGELLRDFLKRQPGKRMHPFAAIHLLHALASGMESVHRLKEYHGDLHLENIMVVRSGLKFELKLVDLYRWGASVENIRDDVVDMIQIFYELLGGKKHYAKLSPEIKGIICGRKRGLILKKFNTAGKLRRYLENLEWD